MSSLINIKRKKEKERRIQVGISINPRLHSHLTIYALTNEITKAMIMRNALEEWIQKNAGSSLIQTLIDKFRSRWAVYKSLNPQKGIDDYISEVKQLLRRHKIEEQYVLTIITGIRDAEG